MAQSRVTTRIPWGNSVVCGLHEVNSLDYKALNKAKNGGNVGAIGNNLERTTVGKCSCPYPKG